MAVLCFSSAQVCAVRLARLASNCQFVAGANNAVATSAIIKVDSTPVYVTGDDFEVKNGCGALCATLKVCDQLKRMDLSIEFCTRDPALLELSSGATTYTDGTDIVGFSRRGIGKSCPDSVGVEIWTKAINTQNNCPPIVAAAASYADSQWWKIIWPKATFTLDAVSFGNAIATFTLKGFAEANPNWGDGPFNDLDPAIGALDPDSPEHMILDQVGPPALGCGYTVAPVPPQP